MARALLELAAKLDGASKGGEATDSTEWETRSMLVAASAAYRARRTREKLLPAMLFGEPAWDILLDLCISQESGIRVSIKHACIASAVAETTALRYISELERLGLIVRYPDQQDRRRMWLRLTKEADEIMRRYFYENRTFLLPAEDSEQYPVG